MNFIVLSSEYVLRLDPNGAYLIAVNGIGRENKTALIQIPYYMGIIFYLLGKEPYENAVISISRKTGLSPDAIKHFVSQLVNADTPKSFKINENYTLVFPKGILNYSEFAEKRDFYVETKYSDLLRPFAITRPTMPTSVNLMTTVTCNTDCVYCYANRKLKNTLDCKEILQLLSNLKEEGVVNATLTGGDIFTFNGWKDILAEVKRLGYSHFISTKTPLSREDVLYISELGYNSLQFSLDSANPSILSKILNVDGDIYIQKCIDFLSLCIQHNINVQIRTVLTSHNSSLSGIKHLYHFLNRFGCVCQWDMTPAFFSEYKKEQSQKYRASNEDLTTIYNFSKHKDLKIPIRISKVTEEGYNLQRYTDVESFCSNNQICLANYTTLSILANGVCSLCEMLYENEEYLLGNIRKQTVKEIWNSPKALALYAPLQKDISSNSPCSKCNVFNTCKASHNKRICYLNIHKTGHTSDYPDPACPMASSSDLIL